MQPKPNPSDFTHNGELQQPHYDNAVRAWEKLEAIGNDELEKAALVKVAQYFKYPFSSSCKEAVELFKSGAEWKNEKIKSELLYLRNNLYDNIPTGKVETFDFITLINQHLNDFDKVIDGI